VQIRHYPVTVSVESLDKAVRTTGKFYTWEGRPKFVEAQVRRPAKFVWASFSFVGRAEGYCRRLSLRLMERSGIAQRFRITIPAQTMARLCAYAVLERP